MQGEVWVNLLTQVPLAGLFIWAMLMVLDKSNKFQMEMMRRWDDKQAERDDVWRKFLDEQRKANNEALLHMGEELRAMRETLIAHDNRMADAVEAMRQRVRGKP